MGCVFCGWTNLIQPLSYQAYFPSEKDWGLKRLIGLPEVTESKWDLNLDLLPKTMHRNFGPYTRSPFSPNIARKATSSKTMAKIGEVSHIGCTHTPPTAHLHNEWKRSFKNVGVQAQEPWHERGTLRKRILLASCEDFMSGQPLSESCTCHQKSVGENLDKGSGMWVPSLFLKLH